MEQQQLDQQVNDRHLRSLRMQSNQWDPSLASNEIGSVLSAGPAAVLPIKGSSLNDQELQQRSVQVDVLSSSARVLVQVDGVNVLDDSRPAPAGRGLHVLVLNQHSGRVMARRLFDTYTAHEDEQLQLFLSMLRPGRLLVFAVKDEASFKLRAPARQLLQRLGSRMAAQFGWRDMWAMVTVSRPAAASDINLNGNGVVDDGKDPHSSHHGFTLGEQLSRRLEREQWAMPARLSHRLSLVSQAEAGCTAWQSQPDGHRRIEFCEQVEGYGQVCDCDDPAPISFHPAEVSVAVYIF